MFTILNDIRGPGLSRSVKIWQTTYNTASSIYETKLTEYTYDMATVQTELAALVSNTEIFTLSVLDASEFKNTGYITVSNLDGTDEAVYYESKFLRIAGGTKAHNSAPGLDGVGHVALIV